MPCAEQRKRRTRKRAFASMVQGPAQLSLRRPRYRDPFRLKLSLSHIRSSFELRNSRATPQRLQRPPLTAPFGVSITQWCRHTADAAETPDASIVFVCAISTSLENWNGEQSRDRSYQNTSRHGTRKAKIVLQRPALATRWWRAGFAAPRSNPYARGD